MHYHTLNTSSNVERARRRYFHVESARTLQPGASYIFRQGATRSRIVKYSRIVLHFEIIHLPVARPLTIKIRTRDAWKIRLRVGAMFAYYGLSSRVLIKILIIFIVCLRCNFCKSYWIYSKQIEPKHKKQKKNQKCVLITTNYSGCPNLVVY